jgi:predicted RNase H-like nuclease (RuvC/YqgF family)
MAALDRLKEKVETWKKQIETLTAENKDLKTRLDENTEGNADVDKLHATLTEYEETITSLRNEIAEKDEEIEAIIAKVEALIG